VEHVFTTETAIVLTTAFERRPIPFSDETDGASGA
jgi:hypothetical protein